ncbi:aminoglycoside phosphotransferase family protein [Nocardioides astragali]|uniref:Aminoglycoside phosphotransferase family protein n=1 Tax=Nocardioides astragali TaxID=1776736 RepID=A0ABW2NAZ2_9ACTN|nr:aminoglycoside phosphotransferase family protein [Nocardioides astragali]
MDTRTVRQLVSEQFPQWSRLTIEPVSTPGWDNYTFHLGGDMVVRLPSASEYALAVEKEHRWLPTLAPQLPVPIPSVRGRGEPGAGYPFPWSVYDWLGGSPATQTDITGPLQFAEQLADFVVSLRSIDAAGGPQPGIHNWFRGATLLTYAETTRRALDTLSAHIDVEPASQIWADALAADWNGDDVWFHGDLAEGNLLLEDGHLTAVIDFGTCGVGDPSCDLAIAWTLLVEPGRQAFRDRLQVDDASWARGRGWALWKTLAGLASSITEDDDQETARLMRVHGELVADYAEAQS